MPPGRYVGRIKSYNPDRGYGFIDCPVAYERWHRDVFILKSQMGNMDVGMDISFSVEIGKEGMPQARDISRMDGRPTGVEGRSMGRRRRRGGRGNGNANDASDDD